MDYTNKIIRKFIVHNSDFINVFDKYIDDNNKWNVVKLLSEHIQFNDDFISEIFHDYNISDLIKFKFFYALADIYDKKYFYILLQQIKKLDDVLFAFLYLHRYNILYDVETIKLLEDKLDKKLYINLLNVVIIRIMSSEYNHDTTYIFLNYLFEKYQEYKINVHDFSDEHGNVLVDFIKYVPLDNSEMLNIISKFVNKIKSDCRDKN